MKISNVANRNQFASIGYYSLQFFSKSVLGSRKVLTDILWQQYIISGYKSIHIKICAMWIYRHGFYLLSAHIV